MASSFFKILHDPSANNLSWPPDFTSKHLWNKIPNSAIIRSANGGYSWRLKIKQIGDTYCFANGWNSVVEDIQLCYGDLLFFRLINRYAFRMSIYSPDGCEKILPLKILHQNYNDEDPFFTSIITVTHKRFLRFPGGFAEMAGIDGEGSMTVKNLDGKEWVTALRIDNSFRRSIRYFLTQGWPYFQRENGLSEGDECMFRFIRSEGKLLLAKVTKNEWQSPVSHEHGGDVDSSQECVEVM